MHSFIMTLITLNYVKCKLYSHFFIVNILNEEIYGNDIGINNLEIIKPLSLEQKLNLEQGLKQILPHYFMQNHIPKKEINTNSDRNMNSLRGNITSQVILMADNRNNFDNQNRFYQNEVGNYNHPQQPINFNSTLPKREIRNRNTDMNVGNNAISVSRTVLMTDSQSNNNDDDFHHQNRVGVYINNVICPPQQEIRLDNRNMNLTHENIEDDVQNNRLFYQNRIKDSQQADLNNFPQRQGTRTDYYTTNDINNLDHQDNYIQNTYPVYTQQQVYLVSERENNNVATMQSNSTTDINRNCDDNGTSCNDN
ncbi:hypothetical protein RclHR1_01050004 [Rhizophagus clarus]|uniref:Uncharacterized protein n=1 Tax=Rhizophagus clarus TaxID=94130 RepID=A0A2Z6Q1Q9_9GLOM|nr:hypothetical protein RclHR1_01050004 [Rhizophagus clarus]